MEKMYLIFVLLLIISPANFLNQYKEEEKSKEANKTLQLLNKFDMLLKNVARSLFRLSLPYMLRISQETKLSPSCMKSGIRFLRDFKELKTWTLKMIDSFGKPSSGMFKGTSWIRGDYDQCLSIEDSKISSNRKHEIIYGKYCIIMIEIPPFLKKYTNKYSNSTMIRVINDFLKPLKMDQLVTGINRWRVQLRFDVCIPSSCSDTDLQNILYWILDDLFTARVEVCKMKDDKLKYTVSQIIFMTIFAFFIIWTIVSTFIEVLLKYHIISKNDSKGKWEGKFLAASLIRSSKQLFRTDIEVSTKSICGIKFLLICIIVFGHTLIFLYFIPTIVEKPHNTIELFDDLPVEVASQAVIMIESYFFISGFVTFYKKRKIDRNSKLEYFIFVSRRYIRFSIPVFCVFATIIILPGLGDGPHWQYVIRQAENTERNWWKYFLHIQNFYQSHYNFMDHIWFMHVLMQLSIFTVPLLFIQYRWPRIGTIILYVLIVVGFVLHISYIWIDKYYIMIGISFNISKIYKFQRNNYYRPYYSHLSSYCFGLLTGYILLKNKKLRFRKITRIFFWIISVIFMGVAIFGLHGYINNVYPNENLILVHKSLSPFIWTAGISWLCIVCVTGYGDIINWFLSMNLFVILDRLTIWIYILHPIILLYIYGQTRNPVSLTELDLWTMYSFVMFCTLVSSYVFYLFIQSPIVAASKLFESSSSIEKKSETKDCRLERMSIRL